ncbi:calpain clp-1-like isoform X1 [Pomacea canaliculata]|uniref:calpain clp-1-like isoform X1 n=1 Tax=Pomacea canaliculata TaxID=400727 RepID=UPI000D73B59B|nr:calpain clp-1-like isoform X1 [Pomacea canaliculata]
MMATRSKTAMPKDFHSLRAELRTAKSYFKDPDFPPDNRSLYFSGRVPENIGQVKWRRAKDIFKNPRFVVEGAQRHDLDQGSLGNCWFVAGAATLATSDKALFERVVPPDQDFDASYAGAFRFNFWWYGTWTEVIVDDYLPTDGRELIYCHNRERPDELWPPLLEKAYAKLRGCYEALDGGKLQDAMVDLTGGISEVISLEDKNKVTYELYDLLLCSFSMKSMLGAAIFRPEGSTESEVEMSNGLYMGHAYSITGFQQLKTSKSVVRLMRLRNPWGRGEWNGAWSDNSREMQSLPPDIRAEMDARSVDEGEFWMSFEDFVKNFQEIQLCHLQIDAMVEELRDNQNKQNWNVMVYHDEWIRGVTAGGCGNPPNERLYWSNPQFYLNLSKTDTVLSSRGECTIIISLMEKEIDKKTSIAIGFDVYKLLKPDLRPLNERRAPKNAWRWRRGLASTSSTGK